MPEPLFIILAALLAIRLAEMGLTLLNLRHQARHGGLVPPGFAGELDRTLLARMRDYTLISGRFGLVQSGFDLAIVLVFFFGGPLDRYNSWLAGQQWPLVIAGPLFFLLLTYARSLLHIPFSLYRTFWIEQRYGFNTQRPSLWMLDLLKSLLLTSVLTGALLSGSFWLIEQLPDIWWLVVWLFFLGFSIFLLYLSPYVIEPLFNTFTPIADERLAQRIREILGRGGISVRNILTMDASRRSTHSNAYFSGIGRVKRIVLFDTLLKTNTQEEIIAILAHEAGHWKKRHLFKRLLVTETIALTALYLVFRLVQGETLIDWFGLQDSTLYAKLLLAAWLGNLLATPLQPVASFLSRHHEREADDYALQLTGAPQSLASALIKLARDNLTGLHPHPWYAAFYYSHPPLPQRVGRLQNRARP